MPNQGGDGPQGAAAGALDQLADIMGLGGLVSCAAPLVGEPLTEQGARELARVFKALGDPVRLRLLSLIGAHAGGEACVCDLTGVFDLAGPTISHHLKVLREAGLITGQRRGTWIYYRVRPELLARLSEVLLPADADDGAGAVAADPAAAGASAGVPA